MRYDPMAPNVRADPYSYYEALPFYSLIESAKLAGVEPAHYLRQAARRKAPCA